MPQCTARKSLDEAFGVIKDMDLFGQEWGDWQEGGRRALEDFLNGEMWRERAAHLRQVRLRGGYDRCNGYYPRHLLTGMGELELMVPRTRSFSAGRMLRRYARRESDINRLILSGFVFGLSTRKVGQVMLEFLGVRVSPSTVSRVAQTLDLQVCAFHRRGLKNRYRVLVLDGVVLSRKTGAGAVRRPILVALGITPEGNKEIIDFRLARSESQSAWEGFLNHLYRRGLTGEGLEMIAVDGNKGLSKALETVFPGISVQLCWAHKSRNILDKMRKRDRERARRMLQRIYQATTYPRALSAARHFAEKWRRAYPRAVRCLRNDLDILLNFLRYKDPDWRKATRTTNAIERRFREVKRRTRPMGVFSDKTSMERILFAIFNYENRKEGFQPLFLLTQKT